MKECPKCTTINNKNANFCYKCRHQFKHIIIINRWWEIFFSVFVFVLCIVIVGYFVVKNQNRSIQGKNEKIRELQEDVKMYQEYIRIIE